jgi:N-acetylglucosaminyldiphosphoundecaprenol N-acetyl-beta-D-mannosaminyltransferase
MRNAERRLRLAIESKSRCFLSTPNLNFLINCQSDSEFRLSVINSDLVVADGMPIVWLARLFGVPLRERVAGSSLFDHLRFGVANSPVRVFFFGGPLGVAQKAGETINGEKAAMQCVGHISPGFGTVEQMSSPTYLDTINASNADVLVVSLGARKGQQWIMRNLGKLSVPVVSHLGAVVNFVAGSVKRAPAPIQAMGLEWIWRIKEEPELWRRYYRDGLGLIDLVRRNVIPYLWFRTCQKLKKSKAKVPSAALIVEENKVTIVLSGPQFALNLGAYRLALQQATELPIGDVHIDFQNVTLVDSAFLGLTLLLHGHLKTVGRSLVLEQMSKQVREVIRLSGAKYLLSE